MKKLLIIALLIVGCDEVLKSIEPDDCAGVAGGTSVEDDCGVCDGDNTSCADCLGIPNGDNLEDNCGTCDADDSNDCVQDCDGTWGGSIDVDNCGVCGGDNTTCLGCDNVPNSGLVNDDCGVCDGDNTTCLGCDNVPNSGLVNDDCGVCGGNNAICTDCNGVVNGDAFIDPHYNTDDCKTNECVGGNTGLEACSYDCAGTWGGSLVGDACGNCGGDCYDPVDTPKSHEIFVYCSSIEDEPNNLIIADCSGVCGGTSVDDCNGVCNGLAVDFGCGICIDYNSISFSKVNDYTSTSLLQTVCNYKNNFSDTYNTPSPDMESSYIFLDLDDNTNSIIISAPHAQRAYRYSESDNTHSRDLYTGAYAQILYDITGMPTIIAKYKTDDPNYYDYIPSETALYSDYIGEMIPYKKRLKEFIEDDSNNIMMVIDLHGSKNDHFERTWAIDIGTGDGQSLNSEIGECVPSIVTYIFEQYDIQISYDEVFAGWTNETVTRFIAQDINKDLDAMQFEMKRDYRGGCSSDTEYYPDNYFNMIMAYTELIFTMNYIYNSEIVTQ